MASAVSRSLELLRAAGWYPQTVQRYIPTQDGVNYTQEGEPVGIKVDPFGVDVVAVRGQQWLGVQVCQSGDRAAHEHKMLQDERVCQAVRGGWRVELWSWALLLVKRGGKARRWQVRRQQVTLCPLGGLQVEDCDGPMD